MTEWWANLSNVNQWCYLGAFLFTALFIWQLIAALMGLAHDTGTDLTSHVDALDHSAVDNTAAADAHESLLSFNLISIRSVLAFLTLFCWSAALYLNINVSPVGVLLYSLLWGLGAMVAVAGLLHMMMRMTETGNPVLATCVGKTGTVYLDIPANGTGEVRVMVSGIMTHVKAKAMGGEELKAGANVMVLRLMDSSTVEVIRDEQGTIGSAI